MQSIWCSTRVSWTLVVFLVELIISWSAAKSNSEISTATKFRTSDKIAEKYNSSSVRVLYPSNLTEALFWYYIEDKYNITNVFQPENLSSKTIRYHKGGLVASVLSAYAGHHNLIIRPDDVWTAIMTQFAFYLNKNAEEFRDKFVTHKGKKKLVVETKTLNITEFITKMSQEIDENLIDENVKAWVLPKFTTTTENDIVSVGVIFMAQLKNYFAYEWEITCGIPEITLLGSVQDWKDIHGRLEKLKEYKLDDWYSKLEPVLRQFVAAKEGQVDRLFWEDIVYSRQVLFTCGDVKDITGWITVFAVFKKDGTEYCHSDDGNYDGYGKSEWEDATQDFILVRDANQTDANRVWYKCGLDGLPQGMVDVDVTVKIQEVEYDTVMFGGHLGMEVKEGTYTLQPVVGWSHVFKEGKRTRDGNTCRGKRFYGWLCCGFMKWLC